ncbi:hypothetical protein [Mucilaginibacter sp.]|uniref:hypothetical protein n=1 Tax=Mucilaginibacter sp. TaxID=1882438 RepID=UPI00260F1271|nr:hypothetical protein [Mucilaginibacter sp.]MDB5127082.1 hypothetical protein [Mucilaginibacter sp.]
MKHTILTIITEVDPSKRPQLEQLLEQIRLDLLNNSLIPFPSISLLHFSSIVISDNKVSPPLLIFENNFDGDVSSYLDELLSVAGAGIHQIYQCCKGYQNTVFQHAHLKQFLKANIVKPNAYHIGNVGRQAKVIRANQELREHLQTYLDKLFSVHNPNEFSATRLREQMQDFVKADLKPDLYHQLPPHQTFLEKFIPRFWQFLLIAVILTLLLLRFPVTLVIIVVLVLVTVLILRFKEEHEQVVVPRPSVSEIELLINTENRITQNHLANITDIKPGPFRLILLKVVLFAANLLARTSTKGKLGGIPSIHFAHWSIINQNKQLLFLSNYDGSWTSYLDDFIDKAAAGLTGIWSNTQGFPYTRFLVLDGARDEIRFKGYARNHQVPSLVWYSAYRDLTVQNIDKDSRIRENLFNKLSVAEIKEWLKLF